jgi:hypothetical protein
MAAHGSDCGFHACTRVGDRCELVGPAVVSWCGMGWVGSETSRESWAIGGGGGSGARWEVGRTMLG